jgi:hypothetical protein
MERHETIAKGRFVIEGIIFGYAESIDTGDIETTAALFAKAEIVMPDGSSLDGSSEVFEHYRDLIIFRDADGNVVPYERGKCSPGTRHVTTNLSYVFNNAVNQAEVRSYFTCYQTIDGKNEIIAGGRYLDQFEQDLTGWHIVRREIFLDNLGDMSHHLTTPL